MATIRHERPSPSGDSGRRAMNRLAGGFLRPTYILWLREVKRWRQSPVRLVMGLVTPLMFIFVLGTGLDSSTQTGVDTGAASDFRSFIFPGALVMAVQAPTLAVGISLITDKRAGVTRQVLVAPVSTFSIISGLSLGGFTIGLLYGGCFLIVAPWAGINYSPSMILVLAEVGLISLLFTALGLTLAVSIRSIETFSVILSLTTLPLLFFSSAIFPPSGLPGWLGLLVKMNPLSYAIDAVRRTLPYNSEGFDQATVMVIGGEAVPVMLEVALIAWVAAILLVIATYRFTQTQARLGS